MVLSLLIEESSILNLKNGIKSIQIDHNHLTDERDLSQWIRSQVSDLKSMSSKLPTPS